MIAYNRGDVLLVPFPFTDQSATKQRPAVVISSDAYNQNNRDIVIMAITTRVTPAPGVGERLLQDWQAAGLLKPSVIKSAIATIETSLVRRKLGSFSTSDLLSLREALKELESAKLSTSRPVVDPQPCLHLSVR